ncbi:MAG TPA: amidohydrolase, partial [Erythrobacter sp.]|nr:amidohydrolase [Erythrobacter sp.]
MKRILQLALCATALTAAPAIAQDVTITNARLVLGDGGAPIEGGTVVVRGGSVVYAGAASGAPAGGTSVDAGGAWVTPGLFATVTTLGLADVSAVGESNDIT